MIMLYKTHARPTKVSALASKMESSTVEKFFITQDLDRIETCIKKQDIYFYFLTLHVAVTIPNLNKRTNKLCRNFTCRVISFEMIEKIIQSHNIHNLLKALYNKSQVTNHKSEASYKSVGSVSHKIT